MTSNKELNKVTFCAPYEADHNIIIRSDRDGGEGLSLSVGS